MDEDGEYGWIALSEYKKFLEKKGFACITKRKFFGALDKDGNGSWFQWIPHRLLPLRSLNSDLLWLAWSLSCWSLLLLLSQLLWFIGQWYLWPFIVLEIFLIIIRTMFLFDNHALLKMTWPEESSTDHKVTSTIYSWAIFTYILQIINLWIYNGNIQVLTTLVSLSFIRDVLERGMWIST